MSNSSNTSSAKPKIYRLFETIYDSGYKYHYEIYFTASCEKEKLKKARELNNRSDKVQAKTKLSVEDQGKLFSGDGGVQIFSAGVEEVTDIYEHLGISDARSSFESGPNQYLVMSDSADEPRYYNCDWDSGDPNDYEFIDRSHSTLVADVLADSEEEAIEKVRREQELPEWVDLWCYTFR